MKFQKPWWNRRAISFFESYKNGDIINADALEFLESLKDECADIIFLDPPFNLGKVYGKKPKKADLIDETAYNAFLIKIITRSVSVLKPGGALYFYHIPKWALKIGSILNDLLLFRHWIAISMKNGFVRSNSLYPAHYSLLYYTKGKPAFFYRPKTPTPRCRHCGKYIKDYGGYKEYIKNGINLSDIWDDLSPVRHKKYKHRTANELPIELLNRVMQISGTRNGLVVDPFAGTGTTAIAALQIGMEFTLCDSELESCEVIRERINLFKKKREEIPNG
jgi:site-specific DNA-methyltransferase (adenine-specific)